MPKAATINTAAVSGSFSDAIGCGWGLRACCSLSGLSALAPQAASAHATFAAQGHGRAFRPIGPRHCAVR